MSEELPYIIELKTITIRHYNPNYDSHAVCVCGHDYHRHFDGYEPEGEQDVGCKYCECRNFVRRPEGVKTREWDHCDIYCDQECDYDLEEHKPNCACSTFDYKQISEEEYEKRSKQLEERRRKCWG
jgi:hypothetical protein